MKTSEDRDMWIRVARRFRIRQLRDSLSLIRRHGANMSSAGRRQAESIAAIHRKAREGSYLRGWNRIWWLKIGSFYWYQRALLELNDSAATAVLRLAGSCLLWPWFPDWRALGQPRPFFRIRTIGWILSGRWKSG